MIEGFNRWLMGRRPLSKVIPDSAALLSSPREVLRSGPIPIPGVRPTRLLAVAWIAFPLLAIMTTGREDVTLAALVLGIVICVIGFVRLGRQRAELTLEGFVVWKGARRLFLPWGLFAHPGNAIVDLQTNLRFPIDVADVPRVEVRQGRQLVGSGRDLPLGLRVLKGDELVLPWLYTVELHEALGLLKTLGAALASEGRPANVLSGRDSAASPTGDPTATSKKVELLGPNEVRLRDRDLAFPARCCRCGVETTQYVGTSASMFGAWSALTRFDISFDFSIWFCDACVENRRLGVRRSTYLGLAFGLAAGVVGGLLSYGSLPGWYGFFILGAIVGPLIGWVVGSRRHAPLAKASYNPLKKTVRLRFRHPGYAQLMAAAIDRTQSEDRRE